ncbi:MAG: 50S ribosomal protein L29 [Deltaproteobacteria bacterium]|nr:50S ribosomal protein L29 [Deltaproteobacteria bacterium]
METKELRQFSLDELRSRIKQWKEELFRVRFKSHSAETKDTSVFRKMRKDIARGQTILREKLQGTMAVKAVEVVQPPVEDKQPLKEQPSVAAQTSGDKKKKKTRTKKVTKDA